MRARWAEAAIEFQRESKVTQFWKDKGFSILAWIVLLSVWQLAAAFYPHYLFPPAQAVAVRFWAILIDWDSFANVLVTTGRILLGLTGAFAIGCALAVGAVRSAKFEQFINPILNLFQGVPALSWVVFAIIWFNAVEWRIFLIMTVTALPAFTFQIVGALRGISKDLLEMTLSFRPKRMQLLRIIILPSIVPDILTAWKVNIGNASRVVVVAELVGATGGVGYELMQQQQLFDMVGAIAWTLQLVMFVLLMQWGVNAVEERVLRYRASSERSI